MNPAAAFIFCFRLSDFRLPTPDFRLLMSAPLPSDPAARPRTFAQRLGLLLILLVLPMTAVTVPTLLVTHIFGQRPRPKNTPAPTPADMSGLRQELDRRANGLLPTPAPLTVEPIRLSVLDPSHVGPRAEKIKAQAQRFGGTAVEGLAAEGEKHLFVDLPAGSADAFRMAVTSNTTLEMLTSPPPSPGAAAARDQLEVFIRAAGGDE